MRFDQIKEKIGRVFGSGLPALCKARRKRGLDWDNTYLDSDQGAARVADPHVFQLLLAYQRNDVWEIVLHPPHEQDRAGDPFKVCRWCEQGTCKRFILLKPAGWH
jgi:hypothetical protein